MKESKAADLALLVLRVGIGVIVLYYGARKVMPIWGSEGFYATMNGLQAGTGAPAWLAMCAILAETAGALGIIVGLFTRLAAIGLLGTMAVAAWTKMPAMNLYTPPSMNDFFFPAVIGLCALAFLISGAGSFSIDQAIANKMDKVSAKKK